MGQIILFVIWGLITLAALIVGFRLRSRYHRLRQEGQDPEPAPVLIFIYGPLVSAVVMCGALVVKSYVQVEEGTVRVERFLGVINPEELDQPGVNFKNPFASMVEMNVKQVPLDFAGDSTLTATTNDNALIPDIDALVTYRIVPSGASFLLAKVGYGKGVVTGYVTKLARSAIRNAAAEFGSNELATTKRIEFGARALALFQAALEAEMTKLNGGESPGPVLEALQVNIRKVKLPDRMVAEAAEKQAAFDVLARQKTQTAIAEEIATRRAQEGKGVANLFNELPLAKGKFTPADVAQILGALADKQRADAMANAVKNGNVNVMVMGGGQPAVNVR